MAFVNVGVSIFRGKAIRERATSFRGAMTAPVMLFSKLSARPSFSSIDAPGDAVNLFESGVTSKEDLLTAVYKHVFGNAYVMESEREQLAKAESDFKGNSLSVRELVRAMAKSETYRKRFFARCGSYRFIELNFKHLLGRAPRSQAEVSFHVQKLMNEGYEAEIDSYLDSEEYEERFGEWQVPRFVYEGVYQNNDSFNRLNILRKHWDGCSTSTVSGSTAPAKPIPSQLTMGWGGYVNGAVGVTKGLPAGFRPVAQEKKLAPVPLNANAPLRMRIKIAENLYQVFEVPAMITKDVVPEWKKELQSEGLKLGAKKLNGVWF